MDEVQRADEIRDAMVDLLLELRREYLRAGGDPLTHWDQLHSRFLIACRTSGTGEQMVSAMRRGLRLAAPSSTSSAAMVRLVTAMDADPEQWIALLEEEAGYLLAMARMRADEAKEREENDDA